MRDSSGFSRYDHVQPTHSKYCYNGSEVLKNKVNIRNAKALAEFEADMTMRRLYELERDNPVTGRFGTAHLKKIHWYIFQDIYSFAGKVRFEDLTKGNTHFCKTQFIKVNLDSLFSRLKDDNHLRGLSKNEFSAKAAYYMAELNMIHPFREENGRTIKEFIRQLGLKRGFVIDWSLIDPDQLLKAILRSVDDGIDDLADCILKAIDIQ